MAPPETNKTQPLLSRTRRKQLIVVTLCEYTALIGSDATRGLILAKECSEAPSKTGRCTFNTCISCYSPEFVSQANYAAKIDLNRGVLRGMCQRKIFSSLPSPLLFPNEGVRLCRTNRPASFFFPGPLFLLIWWHFFPVLLSPLHTTV